MTGVCLQKAPDLTRFLGGFVRSGSDFSADLGGPARRAKAIYKVRAEVGDAYLGRVSKTEHYKPSRFFSGINIFVLVIISRFFSNLGIFLTKCFR